LNNLSLFEYFYRDASNYKVWGSVLLKGEATRAQVAQIKSCFDSDEFFIAEQLGLPPLYAALWAFSDGPTDADHVWHSFQDMQVAGPDQANGTVFDTVENFISRVEAISEWNQKLSPHWDL
jgi:hypothetical protein